MQLKCAECTDGVLTLKDSRFGKFYGCCRWPSCKGSIGAHQSPPFAPLGTPADPKTKRLRIAVHAKIDQRWIGKPPGERGKVYAHLSAFIGHPYHTGEADAETCLRILSDWDYK